MQKNHVVVITNIIPLSTSTPHVSLYALRVHSRGVRVDSRRLGRPALPGTQQHEAVRRGGFGSAAASNTDEGDRGEETEAVDRGEAVVEARWNAGSVSGRQRGPHQDFEAKAHKVNQPQV